MEKAAHKLLRLVESYAVHPGHTVGKFLELSDERASFAVAFDAHQLLEHLTCTSNDGMELLCSVLRKTLEMHEVTVGAACRVNFITYVTLHAYHALAREAVVYQDIDREKFAGFASLDRRTSSHLVPPETSSKDSATRCCWHLMNNFLQEMRLKWHALDPTDVLAEVASSTLSAENVINSDDKMLASLSPRVLHEYLRRTFAYDPLSWGYRAGKLAVDCFLHIRSCLLDFVADKTRCALVSLHAFVEQLLYKVSTEASDRLTTGGNEGHVLPGIALLTTVRRKRTADVLAGTCVCSPAHAFEALVENESCHIDLLLLFSQFPDGATEENDTDLYRLALMVRRVAKGLLVIAVQRHLAETTLRCMESWGTPTRTVLVLAAVGQTVMTQLALAFRVLPRSLGTLQPSPVGGRLRVKALFDYRSIKRRGEVELQSLLLAFNPLDMESGVKSRGVKHRVASVVFGGRCAADHVLMERLFTRQLHHLVNILCLPSPRNVVVPAGGAAEAYAVHYLEKQFHEALVEGDFPLRDFKLRLLGALRSAILAYMGAVLQKSGGLTVEATLEHLSLSQGRLGAVERDADSRASHCTGVGALAMRSAPAHPLYSRFVPTPPLMADVCNAAWSENRRAASTLLLADLSEWEAEAETVSAYLAIGTCLDHLCFTSIMGRTSVVSDSDEDTRVRKLFFYPDIA
ncbi:putative ribose-phosphate pyrophosphokinase [Trypanosoma conorhini]|uniref:Putative ribose-phosphate pyrophosphokinase n=1 Tax=Trypanosoma conorhini TaxID=83891 RepID=A0A422PLT5_9TRYP|nr:putative ribose-phosphate pyrophosphokinase [Trypanosoma conorhini]RNF18686.1 putative ribose-phosphate pyrophosphokinase [Trypanosoma conorhini]